MLEASPAELQFLPSLDTLYVYRLFFHVFDWEMLFKREKTLLLYNKNIGENLSLEIQTCFLLWEAKGNKLAHFGASLIQDS